jgi:4a-hydroxytetrahydrobiopterin dehydratase
MRTLAELLASHCQPLDRHAALSATQVAAQLAVVPDWQAVDGTIRRTYRFADYFETIAFVNALAYMVHREDHHPDLLVGYDRCEVRFATHSAGGVSDNDFICAAKAEAIFAQRCGGAPA